MDEFSAYDIFNKEKKELADGMKNVEIGLRDWGYLFNWNGLPLIDGNIAIVEDELDEVDKQELIDWYEEDNQRRIAFTSKQLQFEELNYGPDLLFLTRTPRNVKAPFLPKFTFRQFSFDTRDLRIDSRKMTAALSNMVGDTIEGKREVERYIGGILHMLNGRIWVVENSDETILAACLYGTTDENYSVYLNLADHLDLPLAEELLPKLIQFTFETYDHQLIYTHCLAETHQVELFTSLQFDITKRLHITT